MSGEQEGTGPRRLTVTLETAATAVSLLGLGAGTQQWQFVAKEGDTRRFTSPTFAAPYTWGGIPMGRTVLPQEEWAPGMVDALEDLKQQITHEGWAEVTHGTQPWDVDCEKNATAE